MAGAAYGATSLFNRLKAGGFSCLPSDFPSYPHTTIGGESYSLNAPTPGSSCRLVLESNDSSAAVLGFYENRLAAGNWRVTSTDTTTGDITFRNVKKAKTTGGVHIAAQGNHTEITVQLYS